jgi:hypothetical protein
MFPGVGGCRSLADTAAAAPKVEKPSVNLFLDSSAR